MAAKQVSRMRKRFIFNIFQSIPSKSVRKNGQAKSSITLHFKFLESPELTSQRRKVNFAHETKQ
ncbi:MAG: hypothetical protein ABSF34_04395 [Verrucomicrobiota bacterium]|jgi:hypothetical protein